MQNKLSGTALCSKNEKHILSACRLCVCRPYIAIDAAPFNKPLEVAFVIIRDTVRPADNEATRRDLLALHLDLHS